MNAQTDINQRKVLLNLVEMVQGFSSLSDTYFMQAGERQIFNPIRTDERIGDSHCALPAELFDELGIRSIMLDTVHDGFSLPVGFGALAQREPSQHRWHAFRDQHFLQSMRKVISDCPVITFSDWASVEKASELWDGFLYDVLKPLNRKDINFLFYLGDPTQKRSYEVDEIIDIVSAFSITGNVTFFLYESDATELWSVLHGEAVDFKLDLWDARARYQSIFQSMKVDRLVVYSAGNAMLFSSDVQFQLNASVTRGRGVSQQAKDNFNAGYVLGLLLQLDVASCLALGLSVYGVFLEQGTSPNRSTLIAYMQRWIESLNESD